jgi:outer membrane protein
MTNSERVGACIFLLATVCLAQSKPPDPPVLDLSLEKAIELASSPQGNTSVQMALEAEKLNDSRYRAARSLLLPTFDGSVAEQNQTVNPRALGLRFESPAFTVPSEVGPFNTFDARVRLTQNLFNFTDIRHSQAAREDMQTAKSATDGVRARVSASIVRLYAAALRADAQVAESDASIADAEALRDQVLHRAAAGEDTDLVATRAKVNVARSQQKKLAAETARTRTQLELLQALGLSLDTSLHLTGSLEGAPAESRSVEEYVDMALKTRPEFREEDSRLRSAKLNENAARLERLPTLEGYADYGVLEGVQTHTAGAALRVPLFNGGRISSDETQATALMHQEQIRRKDLRSQVELEIRQALVSIASTRQQVQVAEQAIQLANDELGRARRRFDAGVTNDVEVMDAQAQLAAARTDRVDALFDYANARIDLAQATGAIATLSF